MKHVLVCVIVLVAACESEDGAVCGNGDVEIGEACDDGNGVDTDRCRNTCESRRCGDAVVSDDEECDDGNNDTGDGCWNCMFEDNPCGNGVLDGDEECDDFEPSSTCDHDCTLAECGDGIVNLSAGEACDDPDESAACDLDCTPVACGDGYRNAAAGEECDDANTEPGDGCSATCQTESVATCPAVDTLLCGAPLVFGDVADAGATDLFDAYTCFAGDKSGPEVIYEWIAPGSGNVNAFAKDGMATDVIVVEANAACEITSCLAGGPAGATFTAVAGTRYLIIVDSNPGTVSAPYAISMICVL